MENTLDKKYTDLLQKILDEGIVKQDRTGTGTKSIFGYQIRHNMKEGFPLLTTKKMAWKSMVVELIWFLRGDTNIKFLVENGCNIWVGDAYKNYLKNPSYKSENIAQLHQSQAAQLFEYPTEAEFIEKIKTDDEFAKKWGELGPIYGKQWRKWILPRMESKGFDFETAWKIQSKIWEPTHGEECGPSFESFCLSLLRNKKLGLAYGYHTQIDQIANLINDLKNNPDSRRLMVNAWNVGELDQMVLPPCHYGFQVYTRELTHEEKIKWRDNFILEQEKNNIIKEEKAKLEANGGPYILYTHSEGHFDWDKLIPKRAISLMWNQRSVDTFLGLPFNIASYGLLLEIIAKEVNMIPDELIGNLGDTHLYLNHLEQAKEQIGREYTKKERVLMAYNKMMDIGEAFVFNDCISDDLMEQLNIPKRTREPLPLPKVDINDSWKFSSKSPLFADTIELDMINLVDYQSHKIIKAPLSN
jgi:thymidylate synthase